MSSSTEPEASVAFHPKPVLDYTAAVGLQSAAVGLFVSALQNALGKHSHGALGVVTRTGGTIGFFAATGATFAFTEATVRNSRQKDDAWNGAAGACAAGFLLGMRMKSIPAAFGGCAVLGGIMGAFDYSGQLAGSKESKEEKRNRFFKKPPRPLIAPAPSTE
ncbi:hypothetical protein FA15DRAFT_662263 [Coprinopsis marcescibilis]|uniref:Uncharacterized protein n=1 Tax=Coprinopsis marcescibilis TaxID=230819 RepID=A0A5C3LCI1_COPMA|nr:hypothetical protein FA15DRAFT_662263 [Coprinopsis marcescibilis]